MSDTLKPDMLPIILDQLSLASLLKLIAHPDMPTDALAESFHSRRRTGQTQRFLSDHLGMNILSHHLSETSPFSSLITADTLFFSLDRFDKKIGYSQGHVRPSDVTVNCPDKEYFARKFKLAEALHHYADTPQQELSRILNNMVQSFERFVHFVADEPRRTPISHETPHEKNNREYKVGCYDARKTVDWEKFTDTYVYVAKTLAKSPFLSKDATLMEHCLKAATTLRDSEDPMIPANCKAKAKELLAIPAIESLYNVVRKKKEIEDIFNSNPSSVNGFVSACKKVQDFLKNYSGRIVASDLAAVKKDYDQFKTDVVVSLANKFAKSTDPAEDKILELCENLRGQKKLAGVFMNTYTQNSSDFGMVAKIATALAPT